MTNYEKQKLSLRYWLLGRGYYQAVDALEYAADIHTGTRKDGVTPEFQHQVEIAHYVRTLPVDFPERTIAVCLLHDVREDYNVSDAELVRKFGKEIAEECIILDKNGKTAAAYYNGCSQSIISSIAKGADRIHNLQSMNGVFSHDKQRRYVEEAQQHFLPMLKTARRLFPTQEQAYENIKHMLISQIQLITASLDYVASLAPSPAPFGGTP